MTKIPLEITYTPYTIDTYSTWTFERSEDLAIQDARDEYPDKVINYDSFEWEYDKAGWVKELAEKWFYLMQQNIIDDVILAVHQDGEPWSPREYNFTTDNCGIVFDVNLEALEKYISENALDFAKNKIQSEDGFIWFGDSEQQKLHYYLKTKTLETYSEDDYISDMSEQTSEWDFVTATLKTI